MVINVQRIQYFIQNPNAVNPLKNSGYVALEVINSPTFDAKVHRYNPITTEQKYNKQISKCQIHLQTTTHE